MVFLIHKNAEKVTGVRTREANLSFKSVTCTDALWELAKKYPDEVVGWCEEGLESNIAFEEWEEIFHHDLIMASYSVQTVFLSDRIGYVDQMPFVNVKRNVLFGTWRMSSDIGGIKGKVLLKFWPFLRGIKKFDYLLNSIAKLGQQNSLFCYSAPNLVNAPRTPHWELKPSASANQLFSFVYQHYSTNWLPLLFWCLIKYEKSFAIFPMITALFKKKIGNKNVDLSPEDLRSRKINSTSKSIDVIIPTIGRPEYLHQTLKDFAAQTHLPKKIIIVEQNGNKKAASELAFIEEEKWPFKIIHRFIHRTGACYARNLALSYTTADWIFLSDDDQRFEKELLQNINEEIERLGIFGLTTSYLQPGETKQFKSPKQWGTFGAGNSIIHKKFIKQVRFSAALEHGYGEDKDFGIQLRNLGCDIIYHPGLEITHLKAPIGGFRSISEVEWANEHPFPKPSPTLMVYMLKHFTPTQIRGYKASLFLKFYFHQEMRNPFVYLRKMRSRWKRSEGWAHHLIKSTEKKIGHEVFVDKH